MRRKSIWEQLGKVLAVVGAIALALLVFFSERAEKEAVSTPVPTATVVPTVTSTPEADAAIELPFVPAKK